jgi:hypothetical protein
MDSAEPQPAAGARVHRDHLLRHLGPFDDVHLVLALTAIERDGPYGECLEAVRDRIPGTRECLLTSLAGDGFAAQADAVEQAVKAGGELFNALLAYVNFAIEHRPYFEVMVRPALYDHTDPVVSTSQGLRTVAFMGAAQRTLGDTEVADVVRAVLIFIDGFSRLWASGAFDAAFCEQTPPATLAIAIAHGGVYAALQERYPVLPSVKAVGGAGRGPTSEITWPSAS